MLDNGDQAEVDQARKVKFVAALGLFSASATVTPTGLDAETVLETDNQDLGEDDLPLTSESVSLTLPAEDPIMGAALADPDQLVKFTLETAKQANPQAAGQIDQGLGQLKSAAGVDLHKDLIGPMQQVAVALSGKNQYEFRIELADGEQFRDAFNKAQTFLQGPLSNENLSLSIEGSGDNATYVVSQESEEVARFAIKGNTLIGSVGPVGDLPSPSSNEPIEGTGALAFESDLTRLAAVVPKESIDDADDRLALEIFRSLGTTTHVVSETTDQLTIKSKLNVGE
jgi:hypothetical protein